MPLDSPAFCLGNSTPETTPLLQQETLWQVRQDGTIVFEWLAETVNRNTVAADETRTVTVSGPGTGKVLNWAVSMPAGWSPLHKMPVKAGAVHDDFSTPDATGSPGSAVPWDGLYVVDPELWNLTTGGPGTTTGPVTVPQAGTVQVSLYPGPNWLAGGPYDMTASSFSAQVTPAVSPLNAGSGSTGLDGSELTQMVLSASSGSGYALFGLSAASFYCSFQSADGSVVTHAIAGGQEGSPNTAANPVASYDSSWAQYWRVSCDMSGLASYAYSSQHVAYSKTGAGHWEAYNAGTARAQEATATPGDSAVFTFTGTSVTLYSEKAPDHGIMSVSIDGGGSSNVDLYSVSILDNQAVWSASGLSASGTHTVRIVNTGSRNGASTGFWTPVQALAVATTSGQQVWKFWTSGDGAAWTLQWTVTPAAQWNASSVNVYLGGQFDAPGLVAQFTSINGEVQNSPLAGPIFMTQPVFATYQALLQAAQARGTIPYVAPSFSAGADSAGHAWTDSWSLQVPNGTDLLTLVTSYAGAVGGDWQMQPAYVLAAGSQGSLGTDRHLSVVFHEGEVTQLGRTQVRDSIRNVVAAADGLGIIHTQRDTTSIASWGQREGFVANGGVIDPASAVNVAAATLGQMRNENQTRVIQVPPNMPGKTVFRDFGIFDWIGIERSDFSATDSLRVVGLSVTVDQDGAEVHELVLQTYVQYVAQWFAYLISKLSGGLASTLGALAASPAGTSFGTPIGAVGSALSTAASPGQPTGSGGSSTGLGTATSLLATPEVAQQMAGVIPGGMLTGGSVPQEALSFTLPGGVNVTFSATPPLDPGVNDLWYNTSAGNAISQWNGSAWVLQPLGPGSVSFQAADIGGLPDLLAAYRPLGGPARQSRLRLVQHEPGQRAVLLGDRRRGRRVLVAVPVRHRCHCRELGHCRPDRR